MPTFLFAWNPANWTWEKFDEEYEAYTKRGFIDDQWSCGVTKKILPDDNFFLIRLGKEKPVGIMASGKVLSARFRSTHYSDLKRKSWYVRLRFDVLLHPLKEPILSKTTLLDEIPGHWSPQASGILINPQAVAKLEKLWSEHLQNRGLSPVNCAEEVSAPERFWEGALNRIAVDAYERNPRARKACIDHYGFKCQLCGFDFVEKYGEIGKNFIHVHHLTSLANIGKTYEVNPIKDLIPVCPNCHAMIHRRKPDLALKELKRRITASSL